MTERTKTASGSASNRIDHFKRRMEKMEKNEIVRPLRI